MFQIKTLVVATPEIMEHNVMFAEDFGFLKYDQGKNYKRKNSLH